MEQKAEQRIGHWIRKTFRAMNNIHDMKLEKYGLTISQVTVLIQLWNKDGLTQKDIQENLNLRPASITGLVDVLVDKGFIIRKQDDEDARLKRLYLTEEGRNLEKLALEIVGELEAMLTKGFSEDERAICLCWMKKLYGNLQVT